MTQYVLTAEGPSGRGLVAGLATAAAAQSCNILDSAQFVDTESNRFFLRMLLRDEAAVGRHNLSAAFDAAAAPLCLQAQVHDAARKSRIAVMVSRFGHCLNDLLYRSRIGALPVEIACVISNHDLYGDTVREQGLAFHHIPVKDDKAAAERRQMQVLRDCGIELVVLARYMQVLSAEMCHEMSGRIINIHHSFLPSFKGAVPYQQAHEKGVKLIGATAHYVTEDLDEGPIIEQDVVRVTHAQSMGDFVSLGRDVEAMVLARAVHAHATHRVFLNGQRTIVFPPSPGSFVSERMG
ncbi:formyltetrahydrofolate deformylase [Paracoccus sp. SSK6]|uniref:formyltetrahydrofolate deformylase n=1 Tax=Paracoccus sp. SSK6 TaxID=3143131 RepID=UPI003219E143